MQRNRTKTKKTKMALNNSNNTLVLVGGTGGLGTEISKGLFTAEGFDRRVAIVRSSSKATALKEIGWTIVEVPDFLGDPDGLEKALSGARIIVSTFSGGDLVPLEVATIRAAKKVGASLFVPSQFGIDYRRWSATRHPILAQKDKVLVAAEEVGLPILSVFTGYFSDTSFSLLADLEHGKARVIGDGSGKISFTLRSDIGYVLAKALADDALTSKGGTLSMQGETLSWKEALAMVETVLGKPLELEYMDAQVALQQEKDLLAQGLTGDMGAFYGSFVLHLLGEPARGTTGADLSTESKSYGIRLETLTETTQKMHGKKK